MWWVLIRNAKTVQIMNGTLPLNHVLNGPFNAKQTDSNYTSISRNFTDFQDTVEIKEDSTVNLQSDPITNYKVFLLENATDAQLLNYSRRFLDSALWVSLQPWQTNVRMLLTQPEQLVMMVFCVLALMVNIVSIIAIHHVPQRLTPHLKLIISLGTADILITVSVFLHVINQLFNSVTDIGVTKPGERLGSACTTAIINSVTIFAFLVTLLNLLAMALDHYTAIVWPLYYTRLMSRKKTTVIITVMWITAAIGGFSNFIFGFPGYDKPKQDLFNYCEFVMYGNFHAEYLVFGVTLLCLNVFVYIYLRIYCEVRKIQRRTSSFPHETVQNSKAMVTTLLIIGTFSICWLPNCIFQIYMIIQSHLNEVYDLFSTYILISKYLYILMLTNCIFDPIIYAVRLQTVQMGYKNCLKKLTMKWRNLIKCEKKNSFRRIRLNSTFELPNCQSRKSVTSELMKSESSEETKLLNMPETDLNESLPMTADSNKCQLVDEN